MAGSADRPAPSAARALALATAAFTACFYVWALFGPLTPALQSRLHLGDVEVSWMVAVPVVLGAVLRVPMGMLTDRFGARTVFPALMAFVLLPLVALALWHESFPVLLAFGFLLGFAGSSFAIGVPYVSRWYGAGRQGLALGVYGMGMGGTVLTALTAPTIAQRWGVTGCFAVGAGLVAVVGAVFAALAREPPRPRPVGGGLMASLGVFRTSPRAWALTLFYFVAFGGFVAMFLYLPRLLVGVHHLTAPNAGARAAGFALLAVVGRPLGGWISDRAGAARVLAVCFAGGTVLAALLAVAYTGMVPLTIACLLLALMFGVGSGAVFKLVAQEFPRQVGAVTGVVGAAGGLGGFFPPLVMGAVYAITGSYLVGFALLALTSALCLGVLGLMARTAGRR